MNWKLTLDQQHYNSITTSDDPNREHLVYSFAGLSRYKDTTEILIRDQRHLTSKEYLHRSAGRIEVPDEITWETFSTASKGYQALVTSHSHTCNAFFSPTDDTYDSDVWRRVLHFYPVYVRMVTGTNGIVAEVISREDQVWRPVRRIKVVGPHGLQLLTPLNAPPPPEIVMDTELHSRTLRLGSGARDLLELVRQMVFAFIGAGGGNSVTLQLLKFLQPRKVILFERDRLDRHSGNRFFGYHPGDEGRLKTDVLRQEIVTFNPGIEVECHHNFFPEGNTLEATKEADVLVGFSDSGPTRYQEALVGARFLKPVFDAGTLVTFGPNENPARITSRILTQFPGGPCLHCMGVEAGYPSDIEEQVRLSQASYSDRPGLAPDPQVITTNCFAATLLVRNILAWLYPGLVPRIPSYLQFEELAPLISDLSLVFPRNPACPVCGDSLEAHRAWGDHSPVRDLFESPPDEENQEGLCLRLEPHEEGVV